MDNTITLYLIKSSIALALFYGLYMLFLNKDTLFKVRRIYFLFAIAFSIVFPLLTIELSPLQEVDAEPPIYTYWLSQIEVGAADADATSNFTIDAWTMLSLMIIGISTFLAIRLIIQMASVVRLRASNESYKVSSYRIIQLTHIHITPFSFFNWIFVNKEFQDEQKLKEIIAHEHVHARQLHSIDVILYELLCIVFWWNPFTWLLRNEMKLNLEYLADQGVLNAGFNSKEYQYILLKVSNKNTGIPIINNFNVSQLKKRITMMNKKRTSVVSAAKYMMAFPLAFVLLLGNAVYASSPELPKMIDDFRATEIESVDLATLEENNLEVGIKQDNPTDGKQKPLTIVEQMPSYPGGEEAMQKFIADNLKYPVKAQEAGVSGRIIVRYVVSKTGEIKDAVIVRGIDPECDKEALRVINAMPKWVPGKQDGKTVDVYFTLPIVYRLTKDSPKSEKVEVAQLQKIKEISSGQKPFTIVEQMPSYPGGEDAMHKFVADNLKYPVKAQEAGISGRVTLRYVVSKTGEIRDAVVVRGLDPDCDKEALRVINAMPKWIPGKQNGQAVDVYFTLPLVFKLADGTNKGEYVLIFEGQEVSEDAVKKETERRKSELKDKGKELVVIQKVLTETQAKAKYGDRYKGKQVVNVSYDSK